MGKLLALKGEGTEVNCRSQKEPREHIRVWSKNTAELAAIVQTNLIILKEKLYMELHNHNIQHNIP